jgi:predicted aminopeptidase
VKKILKNIAGLALFVLIIWLSWNFKTLCYGINQLIGQLKITMNAVPVNKIILDPSLKKEYREKLFFIQEVRRYAIDSLGLHDTENYTTFYDQKDKPLLWVLTACRPFELEAKKWYFPIIGKMEYKGFFKEEKAYREQRQVILEGYETDIYNPVAWSTLGILTDPILSGQLRFSPGRLAELIIHEMTHATVYVAGDVDYNENLATFVGEKGAEKFLIYRFGIKSTELTTYLNYISDEEMYSRYMLTQSKSLDSLYKTFKPEMTLREKADKKYRKIADIMLGLNNMPFHNSRRYRTNFKKGKLPNNTEFMAFLRYRKDQDAFKKSFEKNFNGNLKAFVMKIADR